jgi:hypothetical protein
MGDNMPDWPATPIPPPEPLVPGQVDPPPPAEVQPTDPGWSAYVRKETDRTGLKWGPNCWVALSVEPTGVSIVWPIDGDNPTDYSVDKDWGWKEDRTYETHPPEPYQDFTRWVRHYPKMRTQKYVQYRALVTVHCGPHMVARPTSSFWKAEGQPTTGPVDTYFWTVTSGLKTDAGGATYKWTTTGKKTPPPYQLAQPDPTQLQGNETPPIWVVHPIQSEFKLDWHPTPHLDWWFPHSYSFPIEPGTKIPYWFRAGEVFDLGKSKEKPKPK